MVTEVVLPCGFLRLWHAFFKFSVFVVVSSGELSMGWIISQEIGLLLRVRLCYMYGDCFFSGVGRPGMNLPELHPYKFLTFPHSPPDFSPSSFLLLPSSASLPLPLSLLPSLLSASPPCFSPPPLGALPFLPNQLRVSAPPAPPLRCVRVQYWPSLWL